MGREAWAECACMLGASCVLMWVPALLRWEEAKLHIHRLFFVIIWAIERSKSVHAGRNRDKPLALTSFYKQLWWAQHKQTDDSYLWSNREVGWRCMNNSVVEKMFPVTEWILPVTVFSQQKHRRHASPRYNEPFDTVFILNTAQPHSKKSRICRIRESTERKNSAFLLIWYYVFFLSIYGFFFFLPGGLLAAQCQETSSAKEVTHMADITDQLIISHKNRCHACMVIQTETRYSREHTHTNQNYEEPMPM